MPKDIIPSTDDGLLAKAGAFSASITATPVDFGLTAGIASNFSGLYDAYSTALTNATTPATRGPVSIGLKQDARKALVANFRQIARMVQGNIGVTDDQRRQLGLPIRKTHPTPSHAPTVTPGMDVKSTVGRSITLSIHDSTTLGKRAKPTGAVQAMVYYFAGETYPSDPNGWSFAGTATRNEFTFTVPDSVAGGTLVWTCAAWTNRAGDPGPTNVPISTYIAGGGSSQQAEMKIAA